MNNFDIDRVDREQLAVLGAAFLAGYGFGASGNGNGNGNGLQPAPLGDKAIAPSTHRLPGLPITLDGKPIAGEKIRDYDGKPLYHIVDDDACAGKSMAVFSDRQKALQYCKKTAPSKSKAAAADAVDIASTTDIKARGITEGDPFIGAARLFEHINFQGGVWDMYAMNGNVNDLRRVNCFLWWCQNIDERISAVDNQVVAMAVYRPKRAFTVLHENVNFSGSQLWIVERQMIASLVPFGWNDRASSVSFHLV